MAKSLEASPRPQNKWSPHRTVLQELVLPFWSKSPHKKNAWALTAALFALMGGMVYSLVLLNRWNQGFFDALQKLDRAEFLNQLWRFFFIALGYALIVAFKFYVLQRLAVLWRQWLTNKNLTKWLSHRNYYFWQITPGQMDNPDQRLSDDVHELTDLSLEIGEKVLREAITFVSFIGILWGLSTSWHFQAFGYDVEFHRYLVWACLLYAVIGTFVTHKIGFPLSKLNFMQQKYEADFRYSLVRLRENGESIALSKGEVFEKQKLTNKFSQIVGNFKDLIRTQRNVLFTTNIYDQIAYIFPFVVCSAKVFTKEITMGQLFQISSAFGQLQGSVSVVVSMYAKIMRLNSVIQRLGGFLLTLQDLQTAEPPASKPASSLRTKDFSIFTPQGQALFSKLDLQVRPGERVLLTAPSGKGKSTLLRALNDLWPFTQGTLESLPTEKSLALSQTPYLPVGIFKDLLTYPGTSQHFDPKLLRKALADVQLSHLEGFLDQEANWSQRLSAGEQQRLCFARILLLQPEVVFLDEATSAVGKDVESALFAHLLMALPKLTLVTFSHETENLAPFHTRILKLS
jgi:putative ATP-binding cassette transporter